MNSIITALKPVSLGPNTCKELRPSKLWFGLFSAMKVARLRKGEFNVGKDEGKDEGNEDGSSDGK